MLQNIPSQGCFFGQRLFVPLWLALFAVELLFNVSAARGEAIEILSSPTDARADVLNRIDDVVALGIERGEMPGAVVVVGFRGTVIFRRAYGQRQVEPEPEEMTPDTIFDLASLTKPVATSTSIMMLMDQGRLRPEDPVHKHIPEFAQQGKSAVTVEHLLLHTSGLIPDNSMSDYQGSREACFENIHRLSLSRSPGERFIYSDVGFLVLGEIVERLTSQSQAEFTRQHIFDPLGMQDTSYTPSVEQQGRIATTHLRDERWLRGEVHDPRAHALGGVAGHAGLFSTADDLARFAQMVLNRGELGGVRVLSEQQVDRWVQPHDVPSGSRAWGWDHRTGYSSNRGDLMSAAAIGHGGFTGTGMWIDPQQQLYVIVLTSRLHPDGKGSVNSLIGRIGTIASAACLR